MGETSAPQIARRDMSLSEVPESERMSAWRDALAVHYDMPEPPAVLDPRGCAFSMAGAVLSDTTHPRFTLERRKSRARRDGVDSIIAAVELAGGFQLSSAAGERMVGTGRVTLFDKARPAIKRVLPGRSLSLALPRDLVEAALPGVDLHALTLGRAGDLFAEHLLMLRRHASAMEEAAAPLLLSATVHILAACALPSGERLERALPALDRALASRARRFIADHCHDRRLSPDSVALAIGASRASLYRAFEADGGVAACIRRARLNAARAALRDPADTRRIGEIAFACGFTAEAQFSRAMRAAFGMTPREIRARGG